MSSTSKLLKVLLRLLVLLGVVGFLIVGAAENGGRKMKNGLLNARAAAAGNMKQYHVEGNMGREKHSRALSKFDLNYTSKRRIPNGPDPIHNRRAGNSRQPPGQA